MLCGVVRQSCCLDSGHANTGVNRLYYACFYAVSALLLAKGLMATRHSGLRTLFHQHLIRPGLLPRIKHGYRSFARCFVLSEPVEADAMTTTYIHDVLEVHLPKVVEVFDQQSSGQMVS